MSGLQILNALPAIYWGDISTFEKPLLSLADFPGWATLPSYRDLGGGRIWHFFVAWIFVINGVVYLVASVLSGHVRRDLIPTRAQIGAIGRSLLDHLRLHFPKGEEAKRYNAIQQVTYLFVIFGLLPLILITGLCMSLQVDAAFPLLPELFGGRQSRTLHFICASGLVAFTLIHLIMVLLSGVWNNLRSMITGRYAIGNRGLTCKSH
jgi:thiosulfate reductase cytochrome b subunit